MRAVSRHETCESETLPPLYDVVDPDALETLATTEEIHIQFQYCGYTIVIDDGEITVDA